MSLLESTCNVSELGDQVETLRQSSAVRETPGRWWTSCTRETWAADTSSVSMMKRSELPVH